MVKEKSIKVMVCGQALVWTASSPHPLIHLTNCSLLPSPSLLDILFLFPFRQINPLCSSHFHQSLSSAPYSNITRQNQTPINLSEFPAPSLPSNCQKSSTIFTPADQKASVFTRPVLQNHFFFKKQTKSLQAQNKNIKYSPCTQWQLKTIHAVF